MEKYTAKYSASVDPFAAWRAKAAEERRASMGVHDRHAPPCSEAWLTPRVTSQVVAQCASDHEHRIAGRTAALCSQSFGGGRTWCAVKCCRNNGVSPSWLYYRLLYSAAQLVSAHPAARLFVCVYTLLLHFLVNWLYCPTCTTVLPAILQPPVLYTQAAVMARACSAAVKYVGCNTRAGVCAAVAGVAPPDGS